MSQTTVYLVTGANRGLGASSVYGLITKRLISNEYDKGLGLVTRILEKNDHDFIYAGVRDPDNASSLGDLQTKYSGRIALVKCVSADVEGNTTLAKEIERRHGRLDTVVANAGTSFYPMNTSDSEN